MSDSPYRHIACCYDGSAASEAAVAEGLRLQTFGGGRVSVVHVYHDPPSYGGMHEPDLGSVREVARHWFEERAAAWPDAEAVFLQGSPFVEIDRWSELHGPDLLIAGVHHGRAHRAVLGSVANHLVHSAACPVLIVRIHGEPSE